MQRAPFCFARRPLPPPLAGDLRRRVYFGAIRHCLPSRVVLRALLALPGAEFRTVGLSDLLALGFARLVAELLVSCAEPRFFFLFGVLAGKVQQTASAPSSSLFAESN